ncbi:hypothetical protein [Enterobacter hormaechei]|uniref:HoxN/HupN/NixA family nickel/cobalt transporter n=1 Tax=Enterobacter hormaechei TaxID=158836 RepID=UPI003CC773A9
MVFHPQRHSAWRASWTGAWHSKTMMAAFIIAIKGTVRQAVMLGVAATLSHTAVVWLIAFGGCISVINLPQNQPNPLQMVSSVIILGTAFWMFWRTRSGEKTGWRECRRMNIITMTKQG